MLLMLLAVILLVCAQVGRSQDDSAFTVEIDNFEVSTQYDQKYVNWDTLGLQKIGRNKYAVSGTLALNRNLADEQKINIQVFPYDKDKEAKGPLIFNMQKEVCKFIANDEATYPGLVKASNFPDPGTCPMPKNEYTIDNYEFQADFLPHNIPRGDYLLIFLLKDGLKPVAGLSLVITISD